MRVLIFFGLLALLAAFIWSLTFHPMFIAYAAAACVVFWVLGCVWEIAGVLSREAPPDYPFRWAGLCKRRPPSVK